MAYPTDVGDVSPEAVRVRLRLALRAERAFGAGAFLRRADVASSDEAETPAVEPYAHVETRTDRTSPSSGPAAEPSRPVATLFGDVAESSGGLFDATPLPDPPPPSGEKTRRLEVMDATEVKGCVRCGLSETRQHTVFGEGSVDADVCFVGEGPGENEDRTGRPFVGRAGELLDRMIAAMGLKRGDVYIANVVKCRPPGNRQPTIEEITACSGYLARQLQTVRPRIIVTLGLPATRTLLGSKLSMGRLRGQWHAWRGIKVMPTYHPAYLLRSYTAANRAVVWGDLQQVMQELGLRPPTRAAGRP